jgi:hypothetical protein
VRRRAAFSVADETNRCHLQVLLSYFNLICHFAREKGKSVAAKIGGQSEFVQVDTGDAGMPEEAAGSVSVGMFKCCLAPLPFRWFRHC